MCQDLVVTAFTFGPMVTVEREGDWKGALDTALSEMLRILRPYGVVAIFQGGGPERRRKTTRSLIPGFRQKSTIPNVTACGGNECRFYRAIKSGICPTVTRLCRYFLIDYLLPVTCCLNRAQQSARLSAIWVGRICFDTVSCMPTRRPFS